MNQELREKWNLPAYILFHLYSLSDVDCVETKLLESCFVNKSNFYDNLEFSKQITHVLDVETCDITLGSHDFFGRKLDGAQGVYLSWIPEPEQPQTYEPILEEIFQFLFKFNKPFRLGFEDYGDKNLDAALIYTPQKFQYDMSLLNFINNVKPQKFISSKNHEYLSELARKVYNELNL